MTERESRDRREFIIAVLSELEGYSSLEDVRLQLSEEYTVLTQAEVNAGRDDRGFDLWTEREEPEDD